MTPETETTSDAKIIDYLPDTLAPTADYSGAQLVCVYPDEDGYAKADYWDPVHEVIVMLDVDLTGSTAGNPVLVPGSQKEVLAASTIDEVRGYVQDVLADGVPAPSEVANEFRPEA